MRITNMNKELIFKSDEQSGSGGIKPDKIKIELD